VELGVGKEEADKLVKRAEGITKRCSEEYKAVFIAEYKNPTTIHLRLKNFKYSDFGVVFSKTLD